MSKSFVWFHNSSDNPSASRKFYEQLLEWTSAEGPGGLTMLAAEAGPFAGLAKKDGGAATGWISQHSAPLTGCVADGADMRWSSRSRRLCALPF
jgi:predicted enzyme related to lactoylglutathione lyase